MWAVSNEAAFAFGELGRTKAAALSRVVRQAEAALGVFHPITIPAICDLEGVSTLHNALALAEGSMDVVGLNCYWSSTSNGDFFTQLRSHTALPLLLTEFGAD